MSEEISLELAEEAERAAREDAPHHHLNPSQEDACVVHISSEAGFPTLADAYSFCGP